MINNLDATAMARMMEAVSRHLIDNVEALTDADRAIGDGDHGIGMRRGFEGVLEQLSTQPASTPEAVMKTAGTAIMSKTGGAAGAIFGTMFRSGAKALAGKDTLDGTGFADFLEAGLAATSKRGGARVGQKTMLDALAPAAAAARDAADTGLAQAIDAAAAAARDGLEKTRDMIATTGKARSLGERSLGHIDPGALSVSLILEAMREFISRS